MQIEDEKEAAEVAYVDGYRQLTDEDIDIFSEVLATNGYDFFECEWVTTEWVTTAPGASPVIGFIIPGLPTTRAFQAPDVADEHTYDIVITFPREWPDRDPQGWIEPWAGEPPARLGHNNHVYGDGSICVHDAEFARDPSVRDRWTPVVGVRMLRCWLELDEDNRYDGRAWPSSDVPEDVVRRVEWLEAT